MATIRRVPGPGGETSYRAEVRRRGYKRQSKTFPRKGDADKWARMIEAQMDQGTWKEPETSMFLGEALDIYLNTVSPQKRPRSHERDMLSARYIREQFGETSLNKIDGPALATYRDDRLKVVSPHSVRLELALLSHLYTIARKEWGCRVENPVGLIKKPRVPEGRCPILTQEEIARLLTACREGRTILLYPFVLLALHTGCRSLELRGLRWSQVDLSGGYITIIGEESKGHRTRTIPLTPPALEVLSHMAAEAKVLDMSGRPSGLVFPARGSNDKPRDMHMSFYRAVKKAGLDNLPGSGRLRIHDLRHLSASALIMAGVDLASVKTILGHRDISTTSKYLHVVNEHLKTSMDKIAHLGFVEK